MRCSGDERVCFDLIVEPLPTAPLFTAAVVSFSFSMAVIAAAVVVFVGVIVCDTWGMSVNR